MAEPTQRPWTIPVRAVNAHDDLVAALKAAIDQIEYFCDDMNFMPDDTAELLNKARAVLAKAGVT